MVEAGHFADDHCYVTMHRSTHARQFACLVCSLIDKMGRNFKKIFLKYRKLLFLIIFYCFSDQDVLKATRYFCILNISKTKNIQVFLALLFMQKARKTRQSRRLPRNCIKMILSIVSRKSCTKLIISRKCSVLNEGNFKF